MLYNLLNARDNDAYTISRFFGINRRERGNAGEFCDMENMSSSAYPCLVPRKGRKYIHDGIENKRLIIPPINKLHNREIPKFTGIAGTKLYYEGKELKKPIGIAGGEISQGYEFEFTDSKGDDKRQCLDTAELFPESADVRLSYCYFNNRLFVFVTSTTGFKDLGCSDDYIEISSSDISPTAQNTNEYGNVITINNPVIAAAADRIKGRNVTLKASVSYNGVSESFVIRRYIKDIAANADTVTITLNNNISSNAFAYYQNQATKFTMQLHKDAGKYYYDAGKNSRTLHNAERGIYNIKGNIQIVDYTDETLGITYRNANAFTNRDGYDFTEYFKAGDRIILRGCFWSENNTVTVESDYTELGSGDIVVCQVLGVDAVEDKSHPISSIFMYCYNSMGERVQLKTEKYNDMTHHPYAVSYCIYKYMPTIMAAAAHSGRLWGVNPNGEYVYASETSDPFSWQVWEDAGASSPIVIQSEAKDEYTGILDFGQYVLLLKPTSVQQIYALASSSSVSIARAIYNTGCIDINSAVVIGRCAYYLGYDGFYRYSGGETENISKNLNTVYTNAVAFTDGVKYYASATREDGTAELIVFDADYGVWHKEDSTRVLGAYMWYQKPVITTKEGVTYIMNSSEADNDGENHSVKWTASTVSLYGASLENSNVNAIWLRAYIPNGESITVYTSVNGGEFVKHIAFEGCGRTKVYKAPIRPISAEEYRVMLKGTGQCVVYDMEIVSHNEGRNQSPTREKREVVKCT